MVLLNPEEMTKLAHLWEFHKTGCSDHGDIKIEMLSGGGIGTVIKATCGCGKEMDVTDYFSWQT